MPAEFRKQSRNGSAWLWAALLFAGFLPVHGQSGLFFPQVGDGFGLRTNLIFVNSGQDTDIEVRFFDSLGAPMDLGLGSDPPASVHRISLKAGHSYSALTPGAPDSLKIGYAEVVASADVTGTAIFSRSDPVSEVLYFEAGVPAGQPLSSFSVFLDSLAAKDTGLVLLNGNSEQAQVNIRLYDMEFRPVGTTAVQLAAREHRARFINEFFRETGQISVADRAADMQGLVTVESTRALAALTVRQNDDLTVDFPQEVPTLTVFPVVPKAPSDWKLVFADEFDSFNDQLWDKADHTFDQNLARFRPSNISYQDGKMVLALKKESWQGRNYTGAELRTKNIGGFYKYGRFEVRMKAARGSGIVSSFFAFRWNPWQEIDIEFLGKDPTKIHLNIFYNPGPEGAGTNYGDLYHQSPVVLDLGFDAAADFHDYAFEWEPGRIGWYVDGKLVYQTSNTGKIPEFPQQIMMNLWYSAAADWAGPTDDSKLPAYAEYDYVRFYQKAQ
jgi:beta-glucanase (GH16 family)